MSRELNPRQLRAIDLYMKTGVQSRSYLLAGYSPSTRASLDSAAHALFRKVEIKREISHRKRQMLKRQDITIDKILNDLADDRELARRNDQASAAISATTVMAKLVGLLIDRKESGQPGEFEGLHTREEARAAIAREMGEEAARLFDKALDGPSSSNKPSAEHEIEVEPNAPGSDIVN